MSEPTIAIVLNDHANEHNPTLTGTPREIVACMRAEAGPFAGGADGAEFMGLAIARANAFGAMAGATGLPISVKATEPAAAAAEFIDELVRVGLAAYAEPGASLKNR